MWQINDSDSPTDPPARSMYKAMVVHSVTAFGGMTIREGGAVEGAGGRGTPEV